MRRTAAVLIAVSLVLGVFLQMAPEAFAKASDNSFKNSRIKYEIIKESPSRAEYGEVLVSGVTSTFEAEELKIPSLVWYIGRAYNVVGVKDKAFYKEKLSGITLPDTVRTIGDYAFAANRDLKELVIPDICTSIGKGAFAYTGLESAVVPDAVESIGEAAFYACEDLNFLSIGKGVKEIGKAAFWDCRSLETFDISSGNSAYIANDGILYSGDGKQLLDVCVRHSEVVLPKSVETITDYAFEGDEVLETITLSKNLKEIGKGAFFGCTSLKKVDGEASPSVIGENAFYECSELQSIDLGKKLEEIGATAFQGCSKLSSIRLPKTLTKLNGNVFAKCSSLKDIEAEEGGSFTVSDGMLLGNGGKLLIACPVQGGSITIPSSVKTIGEWAFQDNENITKLTVSSSLKAIRAGAFNGCKNLSMVKFLTVKVALPDKTMMKTPFGKVSCRIFEGNAKGMLLEYPSEGEKNAAKKLADMLERHCSEDIFIITF